MPRSRKEIIVIGVYLRVSTARQETAAQRTAITRWITERGYPKAKIVYYEDHGVSGATTARPDFKRMIADVQAGKLHKVITFELSRLSRDFLDTLNLMKLLADHGVEVEVPGEGTQPFASTMEQFVIAAKSLVASQEREHIKRRIREGLAAAKERGVKLGAPKGAQRRLGTRKEHDPTLVARVLRLAEKLTCAEIGSEVGVSASTVSRLVRRYGGGN